MRDNVLIIMGSHRNSGYSAKISEQLAERIKKENHKVMLLDVNTLKVEHCLDCNYCRRHQGKCILDDDMIKVYDALKHTNRMIVVTPVYFNNVTSKLKTVIDRCQMIFMSDFACKVPFVHETDSNKKTGILISVGGARSYENQFVGNALTVELLMRNLRMQLKTHLKYSGTDHWTLSAYAGLPEEDIDSIVSMIIGGC
jgi:multimeric flavodoxin WrbA